MKRLILLCFALFLGVALWPRQGKSNTARPGFSYNDVSQDDSAKEAKKSKRKSSKKDKAASDTVHIDLGSSKNGKDMTDKKAKTVTTAKKPGTPQHTTAVKDTAAKKPATQHPATQHPAPTQHTTTTATGSKKAKEEPAAPEGQPEVMALYNSLPLEDLPELQKYAGDKNFKDGSDYRKSWIKSRDVTRGYIQLQLPSTDKYTKIQLFKTSGGTPVFVVETNDCSPNCTNFIRVYRQESGTWNDVTDEMLPPLDNKYILGKLKQAYKKQYDDLDIYKSKDYDNPDNLKKAIVYDISPDQKKIIIREQYLPLTLYDIIWDGKSKFVLKKDGE